MLFSGSSTRGAGKALVLLVAAVFFGWLPVCQAFSVESIDRSFHSFSLDEGSSSPEYVGFKLPPLERTQVDSIAPRLATRLARLKSDERLLTITWQRQEPLFPAAVPDQLELCLKGPWTGTFLGDYWSARITVAIPVTATGTVTEVVASTIDPQCSRFISGSKVWMFQQGHGAGSEATSAINLLITEVRRQSRQNDSALPVTASALAEGQSVQRLLSGGGGFNDDHQDFRPGGGGHPSAEVDVEVMWGVLAGEDTRNPEGELPLTTDIVIRFTDAQGHMGTCIISAAQLESLLAEQGGHNDQEEFLPELAPWDSDIQSWFSYLDKLRELFWLSGNPELEKLLMCFHIPGILECPHPGTAQGEIKGGGGSAEGSGSRTSASGGAGRRGGSNGGMGASGRGGGGSPPIGLACKFCGMPQADSQALKVHLLKNHRGQMNPAAVAALVKGNGAPQMQAAVSLPDVRESEDAALEAALEQNAVDALVRAITVLGRWHSLVTSNQVLETLFRSFNTADHYIAPHALLDIMSRTTVRSVISGLVEQLVNASHTRVQACETVLNALVGALDNNQNTELAGSLRAILSENRLSTELPQLASSYFEAELLKQAGSVGQACFSSRWFGDLQLTNIIAKDALTAVTMALPESDEALQAMLAVEGSAAGRYEGVLRLSNLLTFAKSVGLQDHHVLFALMKAHEFNGIKPKVEARLLDIFNSTQSQELKDSIAILSIEVLKSNILKKRQLTPVAAATPQQPVAVMPVLRTDTDRDREAYILKLHKRSDATLPPRIGLGESAETYALRENTVNITNAIEVNMHFISEQFVQKGMITRGAASNILHTSGISPRDKAGRLNHTIHRRINNLEGFVSFLEILNQGGSHSELVESLAKKWFEKRIRGG